MTGEKKQCERILIVDDEQEILRFLSRSLKHLGYTDVEEAGNAEEGFEIVRKTQPAMVITDIHMPGESGLELLKKVKKCLPDTGFIVITASDDLRDAIASLNQGADRYLLKPLNIEEIQFAVGLAMEKRRLVLENREYRKNLEEKVQLRTEELHRSLQELDVAHTKIKVGYVETIYRLTVTSEYRDEETGLHIRRIGHYSRLLAEQLGFSPENADAMFHAGPMHDLGKVGIPDSILRKAALLSPEEFEIMKSHAKIGADILKGSSSQYLQFAEKIALTHHENWDGTGYPSALKGKNIPMEGCIVKMADVYDALRSSRPYKESFDHETACRIIFEGDDKTKPEHFAPAVLEIFRKSAPEFARIFAENQ